MKWSELMSPEALRLADELEAYALKFRRQGYILCPPQEQIFRALTLTPPDKTKIVIVGQDPYHTPGQANGLAFSINKGNPIQPSLRNIFKELHDDLGCDIPSSGDLTAWAQQGVLLLNTSLTVFAHEPNSCKAWGWSKVTEDILCAAARLTQPVVFILWGSNAQGIFKSVSLPADGSKRVIMSPHPSPFSADRGFFGSKPFSTANNMLTEMGSTPVEWDLTKKEA